MNSYTTEHGIDAIVSNMLITLTLLFRERVDQLSALYSCKCLYQWHLLAERCDAITPAPELEDRNRVRRDRFPHLDLQSGSGPEIVDPAVLPKQVGACPSVRFRRGTGLFAVGWGMHVIALSGRSRQLSARR